jgi:mannosyltransferase
VALTVPRPAPAASAVGSGWRRPAVVRTAPPLVLLALGVSQLLRGQPLWYDEAYSALMARRSLGTLAAAVWSRTGVTSYLAAVPPSFNAPYYALLHVWGLVFGTTATALRVPSLLCAAAAVAVVAELARRLAGPGPGLLCGLLAATGPLLLDQAVQARGYGPALLAVALCALWLHGWLTTGRGLLRTALAAAAAGLLHWFTLPVLAGFAVVVLVRRGRRARPLLLALAAAAVPTLLLVGWSLAGGATGGPTPAAVGLVLPVDAVRDWSAGSWPLSVALAVAAAVAGWRSVHRLLVLGWVVLPLALVTAVEVVHQTYFARYLLFTLLGLAAAAALGVATLRPRWLRVAVAGVLVALSVAAVAPRLSDPAREPADAVVRYLAAEQQAGQPVVAADGRVALDLETYLDLDPALVTDIVLPPDTFPAGSGASTAWVVRVVVHRGSIPVVPAQQRLYAAGWHVVSTVTFPGGDVDLRVQLWAR